MADDKTVPEGYLELFDVISEALSLYKFDQTDPKCTGLVSRVERERKGHKINFYVTKNGVRYYHVEEFCKWAKPYIEDFAKIESQEKAKLKKHQEKNKLAIDRINVNGDDVLIKNAKIGENYISRQADFGRSRAEAQTEERSKEWASWNQEAQKLIELNSHLGKNKSELARKIKKKLQLNDSTQTISKRLKI